VSPYELDRYELDRLGRSRYTTLRPNNPASAKYVSLIRRRLCTASMFPVQDAMDDYRYGCVFLDRKGKRVFGIYFARDGKFLSSRGQAFTTDPAFLKWLRTLILRQKRDAKGEGAKDVLAKTAPLRPPCSTTTH